MKKTIAIIASLDTKGELVSYLDCKLRLMGSNTYIIDIGAHPSSEIDADIKPAEIMAETGIVCDNLFEMQKSDMVSRLEKGIAMLVPRLFAALKFDGVISIGGLQNTVIACAAMRALPLGVPKVMVSTVACGTRTFGMFVGSRDILVMPSVADLAGLNTVTRIILSNAAAAVFGMTQTFDSSSITAKGASIGATLMGVTNDAIMNVINIMKKKGHEVIGFHATGTGGMAMEELIGKGAIDAVMDLTLHEVTSEYFGGGFSYGAINRLESAGRIGLPQVVAPGGADFIDFAADQIPDKFTQRRYVLHNGKVAHISLLPEEASEIGKMIAQRLNSSRGKVTVILPMKGFSKTTSPAGPLYDPLVTGAFAKTLHMELRNNIKIIDLDVGINDYEFSLIACREMLALI